MLELRRTALKKALTDSEPQVREAAGAALDQLEGLSELPQLLVQLKAGDRATRIAAVYALGRIHSSKVFIPLLEALKTEDADQRIVAARVFGEKHHPKTLAALISALKDPEIGVVAEVVTAIGQFQDSRLPEILNPLIEREDQIALATIDALGQLGFPDGETALIKALTDARPTVRRHAAIALGRLRLAN